MTYRVLLLAATSAVSLFSGVAYAQSGAGEVEELVVTGTRTEGRSRLETLAPVDVISADALQQRGTTELATALATSVPSITFPRPSNTDGTDAIRPATLRGQGPDQTLVLVNGTRRHATALVNTNGSVGRGARPPSTSTPSRPPPSTVSKSCVTVPRPNTARTPSPA